MNMTYEKMVTYNNEEWMIYDKLDKHTPTMGK